MINVTAMQEINELCSLYTQRWGKEVDTVGMPDNIHQEMLVQILRIIIDTGDSIMEGYQKWKDLIYPYADYLENFNLSHKLPSGFIFDKPCPLCNNKVVYREVGNSCEYKCKTKNCFHSTVRGI